MTHSKQKIFLTRWAIIIPAASMVTTVLVMSVVVGTASRSEIVNTTQQEETVVAGVVDNVNSGFGIPVRLTIPKINVDTSVEQMGLTVDGDMEAPQTNDTAGWYKYGARPGNEGSAVIAGHLGLEGEAVFGKLELLEKGDSVAVVDDRGRVATFIVTRTQQYDYDATPREVFTSNDGSHLNLITCDGDWNAGQNTFADRLVVFASRLE